MTSGSASRVTRSSRSLRLALLLYGAVLAGTAVLRAQEAPAPAGGATAESPPESPPDAAAAPGPAPNSDPADAAQDAEEASAPRPTGPSPGRFEPTEKVRADFDVSFPIDI